MSPCEVILYRLNGQISGVCSEYSFLCIVRGSAVLTADEDEREIPENDVAFMSPRSSWSLKSFDDAIVLCIVLHPDFLLNEADLNFFSLRWDSFSGASFMTESLLSGLYHIALAFYEDKSEKKYYLRSQLLQFLDYLYASIPVRGLPGWIRMDEQNEKNKEKIQNLFSFLYKNYRNPVSLPEAADKIGYTPQYLAAYLKSACGTTFSEILTHIRLDEARLFLSYTEETPVKVSAACGFPNYAAFRRALSEAEGEEPEAYRKNHCPKKVKPVLINAHVIESNALARDYLLEHIQTPMQRPAPEKFIQEKFVLPSEKCHAVRPSWRHLINLGNAGDFHNFVYREHIRILQEELHFDYGRVQGLLELVSSYKEEGKDHFSFQAVLKVLDFMTLLGIKPFLEIGTKQFEAKRASIPDPVTEDHLFHPQADDLAYDDLIRNIFPDFIKICINRYGEEAVGNWMFEVSLRYSDGLSLTEDLSLYSKRFCYLQKVLKKYSPSSKIGGPALHTTQRPEKWIPYLKIIASFGALPDFISVIVYPHENVEPVNEGNDTEPHLTNNPDFFRSRIAYVRKSMALAGMSSLPIIVSEFGSYVMFKNYINDSVFQTCFLLRQILQNSDQVAGFGYWLASDISLKHRSTPSILFGGNGLLSRDGLEKPGFYAFRFLNALGTSLIGAGRHYLVTTDSCGRYQVLFYYYSHFSHDFRHHPDDYELLRFPQSAFSELPPLSLSVTLTGIPKASYRMNRQTISASSGNLLAHWQELGNPDALLPEELEYLKAVSRPFLQIETKESDGTLTLESVLSENDVILFEINRIFQ